MVSWLTCLQSRSGLYSKYASDLTPKCYILIKTKTKHLCLFACSQLWTLVLFHVTTECFTLVFFYTSFQFEIQKLRIYCDPEQNNRETACEIPGVVSTSFQSGFTIQRQHLDFFCTDFSPLSFTSASALKLPAQFLPEILLSLIAHHPHSARRKNEASLLYISGECCTDNFALKLWTQHIHFKAHLFMQQIMCGRRRTWQSFKHGASSRFFSLSPGMKCVSEAVDHCSVDLETAVTTKPVWIYCL